MEYILTNTLLALLEYPGATLLGVNRMLSEKGFRKKVVDNITDAAVKAFWTEEFANYTERMAAEAVPAIQNKIGQFTANPLVRNITSGGNPVVYLETPDKKDYPNRFPIRRVRVIKGRSVTAYCRWRRLNTWTTSPGGDSVFLDLSILTYNDDRSVSTTHRKLSSPGGLTSINSRTVNVWQEESVTWTLGATVNDYYLVGRIEFFSSGATLMAAGQIEIDYFDIR
jgi:hypothetical protein